MEASPCFHVREFLYSVAFLDGEEWESVNGAMFSTEAVFLLWYLA